MSYSSSRILLSSQREGQVSRFRAWVLLVVPLVAILFQVYVPLFFQWLALCGDAAAGRGVFRADAAQSRSAGCSSARSSGWRRIRSPKIRSGCSAS